MSSSEVDIGNFALQHLGEPAVISFDEGTLAANLLKQRFPQSRDAVLSLHHWNEARARKQLFKEIPGPDFGYKNSYPLPEKFLHPWSIDKDFDFKYIQYGSKKRFSIEGDRLLTNADEVYLSYSIQETDTTKFKPLLVDTIAAKVAIDIGFALTGSHSSTDVARTLFKEYLKSARARDAFAEGYERPLPDTLNVRNSGDPSGQTF